MSLFSCDKKNTTIPAIDILTLPSATGKDFVTTYTDSGKLQLILSAPLMKAMTGQKILTQNSRKV